MNPKKGRLICYAFTHCIGHDVSDSMEFHILPCDMYTHTRTHAHTHTHTHILNRCHVSHQSCLDYWSKSEHTDSCAQPYHSLHSQALPSFLSFAVQKKIFSVICRESLGTRGYIVYTSNFTICFLLFEETHDFRQKKKVRDSTN